ncbi:AAA family ATPase [Enterobacter cloacae]
MESNYSRYKKSKNRKLKRLLLFVINILRVQERDSKFLTFDQSKLEVIVYDEFSGEKIQLNDLSSGEKQVISLMSILYLYDNSNKIILIDEPELSLSLPSQKLYYLM